METHIMQRNIEVVIKKRYHDFISSYDHAPEYLYLGDMAYSALLEIIKANAVTKDDYMITDRPYMGMKIRNVVGDENHINVA